MFGQLSDCRQTLAGLQAIGADEMLDLINRGISPIGVGCNFLRAFDVQNR
jgi:hypothetical protein